MGPTRVRTVTAVLRDGPFRRTVSVAPAYRCLLPTRVFGSALRVHLVGAPVAEARVRRTHCPH
jgi:hypothetical protein